MSDLDDLEEIILTPNRSGSAKKIRSGRARLKQGREWARKRPKWQQQLHREEAWKSPFHKRAHEKKDE